VEVDVPIHLFFENRNVPFFPFAQFGFFEHFLLIFLVVWVVVLLSANSFLAES